MSEIDFQALILNVFTRLRRRGVVLGVNELLVALQLLDEAWGIHSPDELRQDLQLLWCHSQLEEERLLESWKAAVASSEKPKPSNRPAIEPEPARPERNRELPPPPPSSETPAPMVTAPEATALPVQAPFTPAFDARRREISSYWPISRRTMAYGWRYLYRPVPDGPPDVLDVNATIARVAQQGFFLAPVYRRRTQNHAHLVLLVDQGGSMMPFHRFTRDLVETALEEPLLPQVDVFYFRNLLAAELYRDPFLTDKISLRAAFALLTAESSVLLVSDAGAARGYRRRERIRATTGMLAELQPHTPLLAWLNPMPQHRWEGTSAEVIQHLTPMFQMDQDGFSSAIDTVRGQVGK